MTTMADLIPSPRFLAEQKIRDAKYEARRLEVVETQRVPEPPLNNVSWFATHQHLEQPGAGA